MTTFIRNNRLYILLLIFVLLMSAVTFISNDGKDIKSGVSKEDGSDILKREAMEKRLADNKPLAVLLGLTSLLIIAAVFLGCLIDAMLASIKLAGKAMDIHTEILRPAKWGIWDVAKVVILFLFFGYMIIMIESALSGIFPTLKDDNLRMILNSTVLDTLAVVFILYYTIRQYGEGLTSLGLSLKNFLKNVFYGIVGYLAALPVLIGILLITIFIINLTKYTPEKQLVVELFLKEKNAPFLVYTSLFAALMGPLIEELFFRGFMYNALRSRAGVFWATVSTAALFAALHTNIVGFLPIMALGILLAHLYEKTGTLVAPVAVHMMHNAGMVFFVFLLKELRG